MQYPHSHQTYLLMAQVSFLKWPKVPNLQNSYFFVPRLCCGKKAIKLVDYLHNDFVTLYFVVPRVGLEPTHLAAGDFESPVSTNFTTAAEKSSIMTRSHCF